MNVKVIFHLLKNMPLFHLLKNMLQCKINEKPTLTVVDPNFIASYSYSRYMGTLLQVQYDGLRTSFFSLALDRYSRLDSKNVNTF